MDNKLYLHLIICIFFKIQVVVNENNSKIIYDQRQTGKYNIHLSIKDVAIIDFGGNEFLDDTQNDDKEDYYYDEDDLTIKPWFSTTTKKPFINTSSTINTTIYVTTIKNDFNVTKVPNQTNITAIQNFNIVNNNNTPTLPAPTRKPLFNNNNNKPQDIPVQIIMEPVLIPKLRTSTHKLPLQQNNNKKDSRVVRLKQKYNQNHEFPRMIMRCNNGGFIDEYGNCRPKRSATIKSVFLKKMFNFLKDLTINQFNKDSSTSETK